MRRRKISLIISAKEQRPEEIFDSINAESSWLGFVSQRVEEGVESRVDINHLFPSTQQALRLAGSP